MPRLDTMGLAAWTGQVMDNMVILIPIRVMCIMEVVGIIGGAVEWTVQVMYMVILSLIRAMRIMELDGIIGGAEVVCGASMSNNVIVIVIVFIVSLFVTVNAVGDNDYFL